MNETWVIFVIDVSVMPIIGLFDREVIWWDGVMEIIQYWALLRAIFMSLYTNITIAEAVKQ